MAQDNYNENFILSDANTPAGFVANVENATHEKWTILEKITCGATPKWQRKMAAYSFTFKFMLRHRKARNILAWQQMFGILPAFYNRYFFHRRKLHINIMTFIYKPKSGIKGKLYHWLFNSAITSRCVDNIFVYSESETEHYASIFPKAKGKFKFVTLGIPSDTNDYSDPDLSKESYYFSTGLSNRDYGFLSEVFDGIDKKLKIACPNLKLKKSSNIELLDNCFGTDMKKLMFNSRGVLIPLKNLDVSSGQLVFITAMQMGKPVIITDSNPTRSYLTSQNAFILPNDVDKWRRALDMLENDNAMYEDMCRCNRQRAQTDFSEYGLGSKIGDFLAQSICK